MVPMVKKLPHRRTGVSVLARVYVHFLAVGVVYTKSVSWEPVHAGVYATGVVHIMANMDHNHC